MWDRPGPGIKLCLLHRQADSLPLSHWGRPRIYSGMLKRLFSALPNHNWQIKIVFKVYTLLFCGFLVAQLVKNLLAMWETWVQLTQMPSPILPKQHQHISSFSRRSPPSNLHNTEHLISSFWRAEPCLARHFMLEQNESLTFFFLSFFFFFTNSYSWNISSESFWF